LYWEEGQAVVRWRRVVVRRMKNIIGLLFGDIYRREKLLIYKRINETSEMINPNELQFPSTKGHPPPLNTPSALKKNKSVKALT
jgi:hypothetical protein